MPDLAYGWNHQQRRAYLLPRAYGTPCAYCGEPMWRGQDLHLDHSDPAAKRRGEPGNRIVHATCNTRAGAQRNATTDRLLLPTRDW